MLLVACYKQHGTIHDATLLKATVACYKVASCMVAFKEVQLQCHTALENKEVLHVVWVLTPSPLYT